MAGGAGSRKPSAASYGSEGLILLNGSKAPGPSNAKTVALSGSNPDLLGKLASVHFSLKFKASYGQGIRLLGSHPKLGEGCAQIAALKPCADLDLWCRQSQATGT